MIVVKVELDVHGKGEKKRMLAVMVIANDGKSKDPRFGNYTYCLSHAGKYFGKKGVYKKGRIEKFPRSFSPYRLIQRCLKDAGEI